MCSEDECGCGCCRSEDEGNHWRPGHQSSQEDTAFEISEVDEARDLEELKADLEKQLETVNQRIASVKR